MYPPWQIAFDVRRRYGAVAMPRGPTRQRARVNSQKGTIMRATRRPPGSSSTRTFGFGLATAIVGVFFLELRDRKSTRLNSSHTVISYAVFCLKKKKEKTR